MVNFYWEMDCTYLLYVKYSFLYVCLLVFVLLAVFLLLCQDKFFFIIGLCYNRLIWGTFAAYLASFDGLSMCFMIYENAMDSQIVSTTYDDVNMNTLHRNNEYCMINCICEMNSCNVFINKVFIMDTMVCVVYYIHYRLYYITIRVFMCVSNDGNVVFLFVLVPFVNVSLYLCN